MRRPHTVIALPRPIYVLFGVKVVRIGLRRVWVTREQRTDWVPRSHLPAVLPDKPAEIASLAAEAVRNFPEGWER